MNPADASLGAARAEAAPWVEAAARAGYAAKGVVYMLVGVLAARAAFGAGGRATGSEGALRTLTGESWGPPLLVLLGAGLAAYALWRAVSALFDPEDYGSDAKGIAARIGFAASAVVHAALALEALRLAFGDGGGSGDGAEHWTSKLLGAPAGPWLVGAVGLAIAAYALWQFRRAFGGNVAERMHLGHLDPDHRRLVLRAGQLGLAARGVIFGLIGFFLVRAALEYDPSEAGGIEDALGWLAAQPWGNALFALVAIGLAAYGFFQLVKARYRAISAY